MKYLIKLIFDEKEIIYDEDQETMNFMNKLGIREIIVKANREAIQSNNSEVKSTWNKYVQGELSNFNDYRRSLNVKVNDDVVNLKLVNIVPKFSRYEGKIFLILILDRIESLGEIKFTEKEQYEVAEKCRQIFGTRHLDVMVRYKSMESSEYLTIANSVPVFNQGEVEKYNIIDESYNKFNNDKYKRFNRTRYLATDYKPKHLMATCNYVRLYDLFYVLEDSVDDSIQEIADDFHIHILSFIRTRDFEEELNTEFTAVDKLGILNKEIEDIWPKTKIELSKILMNDSILLKDDIKIFLHMIDLSSNLQAVIYSIDSKFQSALLKYEERFERLEFNLNKKQKENHLEFLKKDIDRYFHNVNKRLEVAKSSISSFQSQVSNLRADTDSQANFKLQIFMLILTIIFALWGIFTLIYDKLISITARIEGIKSSTSILFIMVSIFMVIGIVTYYSIKKRMYSYITKATYNCIDHCTIKCSRNNSCSLDIDGLWDIDKINSMKISKRILKKLEILNYVSVLLLDYKCIGGCNSSIDKLINISSQIKF